MKARRIHDSEQPPAQAPFDDEMQNIESVARCALIVLVVGDECPAVIGRDRFERREVRAREGALAGTRRTDEHDERRIGNLEQTGFWVLGAGF